MTLKYFWWIVITLIFRSFRSIHPICTEDEFAEGTHAVLGSRAVLGTVIRLIIQCLHRRENLTYCTVSLCDVSSRWQRHKFRALLPFFPIVTRARFATTRFSGWQFSPKHANTSCSTSGWAFHLHARHKSVPYYISLRLVVVENIQVMFNTSINFLLLKANKGKHNFIIFYPAMKFNFAKSYVHYIKINKSYIKIPWNNFVNEEFVWSQCLFH